MAEGVLETTWDSAKAHPWLIGGAVVGLVVLLYFVGGSGAKKASNFTYSYGPTDAQIVANTNLQAVQNRDQTQASIANSYFGYLATANATSAAAATHIADVQGATTLGLGSDQVQIAGIKSNTSLGLGLDQVSIAASADNANLQIAGGQFSRDVQVAGLASTTSITHDQLASVTAAQQIASNERLSSAQQQIDSQNFNASLFARSFLALHGTGI